MYVGWHSFTLEVNLQIINLIDKFDHNELNIRWLLISRDLIVKFTLKHVLFQKIFQNTFYIHIFTSLMSRNVCIIAFSMKNSKNIVKFNVICWCIAPLCWCYQKTKRSTSTVNYDSWRVFGYIGKDLYCWNQSIAIYLTTQSSTLWVINAHYRR